MSSIVSKSFHLSSSSLKIDEINSIEKQGIITILGSDFQSSKAAVSLRRTLSADMSSNNWLAENGLNPIKKIASFVDLHNEKDDQEVVKGKGQDEIWASIQSNKDSAWESIIEEKDQGSSSSNLPPPYIHPLVKRTTSSLSEKSLQICTESLGTETGSDNVFSSLIEEATKTEDIEVQQQPKDSPYSFEEVVNVVKYNYSPCSKKLVTKSFPPPLPSLAKQDGASLQMQSHRQNGRLVLEAVSIPTKNCFHAQREHGRLLLTLADDHHLRNGEQVQEFDQVFDCINDDDEPESDDDAGFEEEEEEENGEFTIDQSTKIPSGVITMPTSLPQSLPPPSTVARRRLISSAMPPTASSFNTYEYFWKEKPTIANNHNKVIMKSNLMGYKQQNLVLMKGDKGDYFVPFLGRCTEPRRSLLFWDSYCIATS